MLTKGLSRTLTGYLFAVVSAVLVAGCGGSSDESTTEASLTGVVYLTARTGPIVAVRVNATATLDGNRSTSPSITLPLSFSWSFSSKPDASNAQLQNPTTANPSFVADARGVYMVQLEVSAGGLSSHRAIQLAVATIDPEPFTGPFNHQGLSSNCVNCHNGELDITSRPGKIPGKSPNHLATSNTCQTCHTPQGFPIIPFVDHQEVFANCSECHNGVLAIGKSEFHLPTVVECDNCHNTTSFLQLALDGSFDHTGISSSCSVCHNGTVAIGKTDTTIHQNTDSDCVFCHLPYSPPTTVGFTGAYPDHTDSAVLADRCDSCHTGNLGEARGKTPTPPHPDTLVDCAMCHNTTNFVDAFVDHTVAPVLGNRCDSCHDNAIATGLSLNHIPIQTGDDCDVCHTTPGGGTFAGIVFDHAGVVDNCASCHDGIVATGKDAKTSPAHIPTSLDCSDCHGNTNFTNFAPIVFDHTKTAEPCASCHASGLATGKTINHIPSTDDCVACHTSTGFTGATFDHTGLTRGCEGCHNGQFSTTTNTLYGKSIGHLPTIQDCYICHNTGTFSAPTTMLAHEGISGNCASCHNGSPDYVGIGARGMTDTAIHQNTTGDCSVCHNTTSFADAFVDHTGPDVVGNRCDSCHDGFTATGKTTPPHVVTIEDCGDCHVPGGTFVPAVFNHTGIVDNCASCHNGTDATGKDAKTDPAHIATTEDCSLCHIPTVFADAKFDHQGIVDNCASCHNGNTATGKTTSHVPTNGDCSDCHVTTGFLPATFDHVGIVDNCASCHDAGFATPKKVNHVATNQDCGVCHTTRGFFPATINHTGPDVVGNRCDSCHNGTIATGKIDATPPHIDTSLDCSSCHTTATFVGGTWTHDSSSTGRCTDCHNGTDATGQPPTGLQGHFDTSVQCDTCHSTQGWAPTNNFSHTNPNYPGDHNLNVVCITCHTNNSDIINYPALGLVPDCAGCHVNDYEPGPHKKQENPEAKYSVSELKNCAGSCHVYDGNTNIILKTRNGEHRVNDRDF